MRALDLFCCDGGAAMGLRNAGFDNIVGIDIDPHPNYPFDFIQGDATNPPVDPKDFDFIWASPPCQAFSDATINTHHLHQNLIPQTRKLLEASGKPYCIENVPKAPIKKHLVLCGAMFGLKTYRHRHFEISGFRTEQPRHPNHLKKSSNGDIFCICGSSPLMPGHFGNKLKRKQGRVKLKEKISEAGGVLKLYQETMGIYHSTNPLFIAEAVPPSYSEYIGKEFFRTHTFYKQLGVPK